MKIRVSLFFYFLALAMLLFGYGREFLCYFIAMLLHELSHAVVARKLGFILNEFRLMPYGVALIGEFESAKPTDEIKIAVVGPLFNLALVILLSALWWFFPAIYIYTYPFAQANFCLFIVNLLPVYPLDGGRILLALLSKGKNRAKAYKKMRIAGYIVSAIFAVLFLCSCFLGVNLSLASMSAFILLSTAFPDNRCYYQSLYRIAYRREKIKKGMEAKTIVLPKTAMVEEAVKQFSSSHFTFIKVVDENLSVLGEVTESQLENAKIGQKLEILLKNG